MSSTDGERSRLIPQRREASDLPADVRECIRAEEPDCTIIAWETTDDARLETAFSYQSYCYQATCYPCLGWRVLQHFQLRQAQGHYVVLTQTSIYHIALPSTKIQRIYFRDICDIGFTMVGKAGPRVLEQRCCSVMEHNSITVEEYERPAVALIECSPPYHRTLPALYVKQVPLENFPDRTAYRSHSVIDIASPFEMNSQELAKEHGLFFEGLANPLAFATLVMQTVDRFDTTRDHPPRPIITETKVREFKPKLPMPEMPPRLQHNPIMATASSSSMASVHSLNFSTYPSPPTSNMLSQSIRSSSAPSAATVVQPQAQSTLLYHNPYDASHSNDSRETSVFSSREMSNSNNFLFMRQNSTDLWTPPPVYTPTPRNMSNASSENTTAPGFAHILPPTYTPSVSSDISNPVSRQTSQQLPTIACSPPKTQKRVFVMYKGNKKSVTLPDTWAEFNRMVQSNFNLNQSGSGSERKFKFTLPEYDGVEVCDVDEVADGDLMLLQVTFVPS